MIRRDRARKTLQPWVYRERMTAEGSTDTGNEAASERLRHLLNDLEGAPNMRPPDLGWQHQRDVCDEIEAIVKARGERRAA